MRHLLRQLTLLAAALSFTSVVSAANIITVADSDPDNPGTANIATNGPLAVSWTQTQAFTNVTIRAAIGFGATSGSSTIVAFLTTQIGTGTTAAQQVATTGTITAPIVVPNTPVPLLTLFSGLSLGPGTYFLSVFPVSGGTASWDFENPSALTSDFGSTPAGFFRAPSIDGTYAPASAFASQSFGPGFFQVTGDPLSVVQIPTLDRTGFLVFFAALAAVAFAFIRRRHAGSI